jgi:hypothetical protein
MSRLLVCVLLAGMTALGTEVPPTSPSVDQASVVTFNKDVLPILQTNCQTCHRPGGIAPMSLMTYEKVRPWAKAIKAAVINKQMPPWFADPHYGEFRNAPKLTPADVNILVAWADTGAREGDIVDRPPVKQFTDGWRIQPDVVVSMREPYYIPATGAGEIKEFFVPNPFSKDTWVTSIEVRPGNPSVVHHVIVQIPEEMGPRVFQDVAAVPRSARRVDQVPPPPPGGGSYSSALARLRERTTGRGAFTTMEAVYAPGSPPIDFRYTNSAKLIRAGKPIRIEVHYTPNGKATTDQTKIGFTLAKRRAPRRFVIMAPEHLVDSRKPIPAGEVNWETKGELTFTQDVDLVWFMPHMHLRGKDMTFRLIFPGGREETVLSAKFNFHWQLGYEVEQPIKVPKGTRMIVTAHHDNSANNPLNPEPGKPVRWGEMTGQEMMLPWFGVVVDGDSQPDMIASYKPGDLDGPLPNGGLPGRLRIVTPPVTVVAPKQTRPPDSI